MAIVEKTWAELDAPRPRRRIGEAPSHQVPAVVEDETDWGSSAPQESIEPRRDERKRRVACSFAPSILDFSGAAIELAEEDDYFAEGDTLSLDEVAEDEEDAHVDASMYLSRDEFHEARMHIVGRAPARKPGDSETRSALDYLGDFYNQNNGAVVGYTAVGSCIAANGGDIVAFEGVDLYERV